MTHIIVWRFDVPVANQRSFETAYGPAGPWALLFARFGDHLGTELIRTGATSYLTIDSWRSEAAYRRFRQLAQQDYERIDDECAELTIGETLIGAGNQIGRGTP